MMEKTRLSKLGFPACPVMAAVTARALLSFSGFFLAARASVSDVSICFWRLGYSIVL